MYPSARADHPFSSRDAAVRYVRELVHRWIVEVDPLVSRELPREDLLMSAFGVQRSVVRDALTLLADAGVVERKRGTGTAGLQVSPAFALRATAHGYRPGTVGEGMPQLSLDVLAWERIATPTPLISLFPAASEHGFLYVELLSWSHGVPLAIGSHVVRAPECDLLDRGSVELNWYDYLTSAGAILGESDLTMRAEAADAADAIALRVPAGAPVLTARGRILDKRGDVVSFFSSRSTTAYTVSPRS